jgi:hypothetical protein
VDVMIAIVILQFMVTNRLVLKLISLSCSLTYLFSSAFSVVVQDFSLKILFVF